MSPLCKYGNFEGELGVDITVPVMLVTFKSVLSRLHCCKQAEIHADVTLNPRQRKLGDKIFAYLAIGLAQGWHKDCLIQSIIQDSMHEI